MKCLQPFSFIVAMQVKNFLGPQAHSPFEEKQNNDFQNYRDMEKLTTDHNEEVMETFNKDRSMTATWRKRVKDLII